MSKRTQISLSEWESLFIPGEQLSESDRALAKGLESGREGKFTIDELRDGLRLKASSWCGVLRFARFEIRIRPKLANGNDGLVKMLEHTAGLDSLRFRPGDPRLDLTGASLLDLLAKVLARACQRVIRGGVLADYVSRADDIPVVRGRILADRQVLERFGRLDRLICQYDEHEQDIVENQLLAAALDCCLRRVRNIAVRHQLRQVQAVFSSVCNFEKLDLAQARQGITYNRLNDHYREAHKVAWILLDGLGVENLLEQGDTRCFSFLIEMNRLFELFLSKVLEKLLGDTHRLKYQAGSRSIIWNMEHECPYSNVIPDFILASRQSPGQQLTVDAKYKRYDFKKISSGDIYQIFIYAYAYGQDNEKMPSALLVYPAEAVGEQPTHLEVRSTGGLAGAKLVAMGLSIPEAIAWLEGGEPGVTIRRLKQLVLHETVGLEGVPLTSASSAETLASRI